MNEFEKLGLDKNLIRVLDELRITVPTEIQQETIPHVLEGKDVIGNASTGSGKTLAFAAGLLKKSVEGEKLQALVLTPTRELAEQIAQVIRSFAKYTKLEVQEIYGGVNIDRQVVGLRHAEIVVGTPGRILDHLQRRTINFSALKILVLDEADRMADMGFLPDVERIISHCPKKRQTLLFSATTSQDVSYIARKHMNEPITVTVEQYVDPSKLQQVFYDVSHKEKFSLLVHLLKAEKSGIVMVFCNTRRNVDLVVMNLKRYDIHALAIHGGLDQKKRLKTIEKFHSQQADILVCTDVAARGLDIKDVTHVYNYDSPKTSGEYIHRIGRTARAGKEGMAISIVSSRDYENFRNVKSDDSLTIKQVDVPKHEKLSPKFRPERPGFGKDFSIGYRGRGRESHGQQGGRRDSSRGHHGRTRDTRGGYQGNRRDSSRSFHGKPRSTGQGHGGSRRDSSRTGGHRDRPGAGGHSKGPGDRRRPFKKPEQSRGRFSRSQGHSGGGKRPERTGQSGGHSQRRGQRSPRRR